MSKKAIVHVNDLPGFQWASAGNNDGKFGKVCISHNSFWLRDCEKGKDGVWTGYIDNQPIKGDLNLGDKVTFVIDIGD